MIIVSEQKTVFRAVMTALTMMILMLCRIPSVFAEEAAAVLPSSLTVIGESAFEGDSALTTVDIPESVQSIGASAFQGTGATLFAHNDYVAGYAEENRLEYLYPGKEPELCTVTYLANGGTFPSTGASARTVEVEKNTDYEVGGEQPVRAEYRFVSWMMNGAAAPDTLTVTADVEFTAQWEALPRPVFTTQPKHVSVPPGYTATFTAQATGTGTISYQWQIQEYKTDDNGGRYYDDWVDAAGATGSTYSFVANTSHDEMRVRCIAYDSIGTRAASSYVYVTCQDLEITYQTAYPVVSSSNHNRATKTNASAVLICNAKGIQKQFQWEISEDGQTWSELAGETADSINRSTGTRMSQYGNIYDWTAYYGQYYRCRVTDVRGFTVYSEPMRFLIDWDIVNTTFSGKQNTRTIHSGGTSQTTIDNVYFTYTTANYRLYDEFDGTVTDVTDQLSSSKILSNVTIGNHRYSLRPFNPYTAAHEIGETSMTIPVRVTDPFWGKSPTVTVERTGELEYTLIIVGPSTVDGYMVDHRSGYLSGSTNNPTQEVGEGVFHYTREMSREYTDYSWSIRAFIYNEDGTRTYSGSSKVVSETFTFN